MACTNARRTVQYLIMKSNTHPKWNHQAKVTCSCGNVFTTGSQQDDIQVDICSACHPFFTGEMRFVDVQGRVDKFMSKRQAASQYLTKKKQKKASTSKHDENLSLRELLAKEKKKLETAAQAN